MAARLDQGPLSVFKPEKFDHSVEEIVQRLNKSLPVNLSSSDVEQNPGVVKLLMSLTQFIGPDGTTVGIKKESCEIKDMLDRQKENWLQMQILYDELQELLLDHRLKASESSLSARVTFYEAVSEMLKNAEIYYYLHCSSEASSKNSLLGLKKEDLERNNPHRKHIQSVQQQLIPEIESRLRKRCETLVIFHDPPTDAAAGDLDRFSFAKASQLPAVLEMEQQSLELEKVQLKKDRASRQAQFSKYYESLMESLQLLTDLITKHRLKLNPEYNNVTIEWLLARCDAMCLKIRVLELQLMFDTYYVESVNALNTIRRDLNLSINETRQELAQATHALRIYESVGRDFDSVVQEFTRTRDELDNKKWALHELKKHRMADEPAS